MKNILKKPFFLHVDKKHKILTEIHKFEDTAIEVKICWMYFYFTLSDAIQIFRKMTAHRFDRCDQKSV